MKNWMKITQIEKMTFGFVLLLLFAAACSPASLTNEEELLPSSTEKNILLETSPDAKSTEPVPPPQGETETNTPQSTYTPNSIMDKLIEQAIQDLSARSSIPPAEISVLEARAVVWPDASFGCPRPDKVFRLVPQDGVYILLQANGINYSYHSGDGQEPFLCETPGKEITPPPKIDITKHVPPPIDDIPGGDG